jgi:hypothetical protein
VAEAAQAVESSSRPTDSTSDEDNSSDLDTIRNRVSTQETFSTTTSGFGGATPEIPDSQDDSSALLTPDEGSVELGNRPRSRGAQESQDDDSQHSEQGSVDLDRREPTPEVADSQPNSQRGVMSNDSSDEESRSSSEAGRSATPRPRHALRDGRTEVPETDLESEHSGLENFHDSEDSRAGDNVDIEVEEASIPNTADAADRTSSDRTGTGDLADDEGSDRDTL